MCSILSDVRDEQYSPFKEPPREQPRLKAVTVFVMARYRDGSAPLPEVSGPTGIGPDGLPSVNPSIVGLPGDDARVLAFAHPYERWAYRFMPTPPVAGLGRSEPW